MYFFGYYEKNILYLQSNSGQEFSTGCSVARLSRLLWEQEAAGSNPATPTFLIRLYIQSDFFLEKLHDMV